MKQEQQNEPRTLWETVWDLIMCLVMIGVLIAVITIPMIREAQKKREARDEYLIRSFSPMSTSPEIQDAYNRLREKN
jgi:hypothetical protein